jgi:hypothetical protein
MLCRAKVNLPDWPEGDARDVDPNNERTAGLLRAGYIVPLQLPRRAAPESAEAAPASAGGVAEPEPDPRPARTATKRKKPQA